MDIIYWLVVLAMILMGWHYVIPNPIKKKVKEMIKSFIKPEHRLTNTNKIDRINLDEYCSKCGARLSDKEKQK